MIQSFIIPVQMPDQSSYIVLDTIFKHQHIITACGIGKVESDEAFLTETARNTLDAACAYAAQAIGTEFTFYFWEVTEINRAKNRVIKGLNDAIVHPKSVMFFVCRDHLTYDAAMAALNLKVNKNSTQ